MPPDNGTVRYASQNSTGERGEKIRVHVKRVLQKLATGGVEDRVPGHKEAPLRRTGSAAEVAP